MAFPFSLAEVETIDGGTGELARMCGEENWPAVNRFLGRREAVTWPGWVREMTKLVNPAGSQYTPADLSRVCDDDEALTRPIGSPYALRKFLMSARIERMAPSDQVRPITNRGGVAQRTFDKGKQALEGM